MYIFLLALLLLLVPLPASAQVQVNLGISFAEPPPLVVVPGVESVQYVSSGSNNVFFYGGQYWAYTNGGWYSAGGYNGPWVMAQPEYVPQPLLVVPVTYYRRPPPEWRSYHGVPPRWGNNYGRSWQGHREVFVAPHGAPAHQPAARPPPPREQTMHEAPPPHAVQEARPAERAPVREAAPAEHERPPAEHGGEEPHH